MRDDLKCIIFITLLLLFPNLVWSHGGENHDSHNSNSSEIELETSLESQFSPEDNTVNFPEMHEDTSTQEDTYGIGATDGSMELTIPKDPLSGSKETSLFEKSDPLGMGAQPEQKSESHADHSGHDMGKMKKVNLAEHEWNATSQKGYGFAFSFTLIILFFFLLLMLKRPFE